MSCCRKELKVILGAGINLNFGVEDVWLLIGIVGSPNNPSIMGSQVKINKSFSLTVTKYFKKYKIKKKFCTKLLINYIVMIMLQDV